MKEDLGKLRGLTEIDDTKVGTRRDVKGYKRDGQRLARGAAVVGMNERGGRLRVAVAPDMRRRTVPQAVREAVDLKRSSFVTDGAYTYQFLIDGSFHHISGKHAHRYLSEFEGRHKHKGAVNMTDSILLGAQSKGLRYDELTAGQKAVML